MKKVSSILEASRRAGGAIDSWGGWDLASHFGNPAEEQAALLHHGGLGDFSDWGILEITGKDREEFLQRLLSNDLSLLEPGDGQESMLLSPKGKILSHFWIFRRANSFFCFFDSPESDSFMAALDKFRFSEDVSIDDRRTEWGAMGVIGNQARLWLESRLSDHPFSEREVFLSESSAGFLLRCPAFGPAGFFLLLSRAKASEWFQQTRESTSPKLQWAGRLAWEHFRIETGIPRFGTELTEEVYPPEVNLTQGYSLTKGCYAGQEVLAKMNTYGNPPRKLIHLYWDFGPGMGDDFHLYQDQKPVGKLTSWSENVSSSVVFAMGLVKRGCLDLSAPLHLANGVEPVRKT